MRQSPSPTRRFVMAALSCLMVVAVAAPAVAAGAFEDDDGNVHEANIDFIASEGITFGCNPPANTHYCPDDFVTREQMASFLARAFDMPPATVVDRFNDDDTSVHEANIDAIAEAGITLGCNPPANTEYCPTDFVTREQMASFIIRGLGDVVPFNAPIFDDVARGGVHTRDINALAGVLITLGCNPPDNDEYCPNDLVTRAQMASFLARMVQLGDQRPPSVSITQPADLATIITALDSGTLEYTADVTFAASATDPNGDTIASYDWASTVDGTLGSGNPLTTTVAIPRGSTSSQPYISVVGTDSTGLFSGAEIQIKLILPSP